MGQDKPTTKPPRRRWLRRSLLVVLSVAVVLIVFHRPLLRWAIEGAGRHFAPMAGLKLDWSVDGTVTSDLALNKISARGDGVVRRIEARRIAAGYSLPGLVREGAGSVLQSLEIDDADVAINLREGTAETKPAATESSSALPDVKLPRVAIRNLSADIVTADDEIVMRGFTLELDEQKPGNFEIVELIIPGAEIHLMGVRGRTEVQGKKLIITDLTVMDGLSIPKLAIDLAELKAGIVGFELRAAAGGGVGSLVGRLVELGKIVEAELRIEHLTSTDLEPFGLVRDDLDWELKNFTVGLKGPPAAPRKLDASVSIEGSGIKAGAAKIDNVVLNASLRDGSLALTKLSVGTGQNALNVTADMALPEAWSGVANAAARAKWSLDAPALESFFTGAPPVAGGLKGEGTLGLDKGKLSSATALLDGSTLTVAGMKIASLKADITTDAEAVIVKSFTATLDDQNSVGATGSLSLAGSQQAQLSWKADLKSLDQLAKSDALRHLALPIAGQLHAEGDVNAAVEDLKKADFAKLSATVQARLGGFAWDQHALKDAALELQARNGLVKITKLDLNLDDKNSANLTGNVSLAEALPFDLSLQVQGDDLAAIAKTAGATDAPLPEAGTLSTLITAKGRLRDVMQQRYDELTAAASVSLHGLQMQDAKMESFVLDAALDKGRADLKKLALRLNEWNTLSATGHMDIKGDRAFDADISGKLSQLTDLAGWMKLAKAPAITAGSADLAWKGKGNLIKLDVKGAGSVAVNGFQMESMPDPLTLNLEAHHDGAQTEVTRLEATSGKLHANVLASGSPSSLKIHQLTLKAGETKLIEGTVDVPLSLAADPRPAVPIDGTKPISIRLKMDKLDFAQLFAVIGQPPPVTGCASMDAVFHGLLPQLEGHLLANLDRVVAMKDKLEPASASLDVALGGGKLGVHLVADQKPLKTLDAAAEIPFNMERVLADPKSLMEEPLSAHVSLPDSELDVITRLTPAVAEIKGHLGLVVDVSGSVSSPKMKGALRADVPLAVMTAPQAPEIKDLKARVSFEGEQIKIEDISALLAGGSAKIGGTINLKDIKNPGFDIKIAAQDALLVRDESISQRANANLAVLGSLSKADVSGRVDLTRGRVFKEIEFLPLSLPESLPPPPASARRAAAAAVQAPPPFDQWTFNIDIGTHDPIRLLGNILNGGVLVDLHARGTGAAPTLEGKVTLDGARLRLPFSRVALTRGNILFSKEKLLEPELDIEGESLVDRYHVTLAATGSALDPKVRFSSSPPLSEGDIATLLATGATSDDLKSAGGVAANKAAFLFVTQLYRKLFKKSGRQHYDDEPPKLSFSFSMLNSGGSSRSVSAVYEVSPKVQAVGSVAENGGFRGLLYYLIRFK